MSRPVARRLWEQIQQKRKFHKRADGLWWNQRLEEVRDEAHVRIAVARNRGKNGAAARWGKGANGAQAVPEHSLGNAQALPEQSPGDGSQVKLSTYPPKPSRKREGSRKRNRALADPWNQREKTAEVKRLMASGMSQKDAYRVVGW